MFLNFDSEKDIVCKDISPKYLDSLSNHTSRMFLASLFQPYKRTQQIISTFTTDDQYGYPR